MAPATTVRACTEAILLARKARPLPPADINPWGKTVEEDLGKAMDDIDRLSVNTAGALQAAGAAVTATKKFGSAADLIRSTWSNDITVGVGWSTNGYLPKGFITSPTGRIEINFGGAIRNGSARICFTVTRAGSPVVDREAVRIDFARCLAITGGATFPASAHRVEIVDVGTEEVYVQIEAYGEAAGVVLSGASLSVRPSL